MLSEEASFVGFYGVTTDSKINILGLITQNITCSNPDVAIPTGGTGDRIYDPNAKEDDEEERQMTMIILASIAGGVFCFFCCIWGCLCRKKSQKEQSLHLNKVTVLFNNIDEETE